MSTSSSVGAPIGPAPALAAHCADGANVLYRGCAVTYLPVDSSGRIELKQRRDALRPETIFVSIMWANNEIGTFRRIHLGRIAKICSRHPSEKWAMIQMVPWRPR